MPLCTCILTSNAFPIADRWIYFGLFFFFFSNYKSVYDDDRGISSSIFHLTLHHRPNNASSMLVGPQSKAEVAAKIECDGIDLRG